MSKVSTVFDSTVDEFTDRGIFETVKGKQNIALIGFTKDGDVFGGFSSVAVTEQWRYFYDPTMFVFSFESHGRCETPQRFAVKEEHKHKKFVCFCCQSMGNVSVNFGGDDGYFYLGHEKSRTRCCCLSDGFEGIKNTTLTGKKNCDRFTCTRVVAVHLE